MHLFAASRKHKLSFAGSDRLILTKLYGVRKERLDVSTKTHNDVQITLINRTSVARVFPRLPSRWRLISRIERQRSFDCIIQRWQF